SAINGGSIGNFFGYTSNGRLVVSSDLTASGAIDIQTNNFRNASFNVTGTTIGINSMLGSGLTIDGTGGVGGTLTATTGDIFISASATTAAHSLTFTGTTNFVNAVGQATNLFADAVVGQQLVISTGANVAGNQTVNAYTCNLVLQGSLTGNPLNLICVTGAGTIANNAGDVDLALVGGGFNFFGQDLAIIASGSVINTAGPTTINLSNAAGNGGDLTVLSGYNFTPATGGQVGPDGTVYTVTGPTGLGGDILLSDVTINTSATGAGNSGGNVLMIAAGGTVLDGIIQTGDINATGTVNGGNITTIADGNMTLGQLSTNGMGIVSLNNASANMVAGTQIGNGKVLVGGFSVGTASNGVVTAANVTATTLNLFGGNTAFTMTNSQVSNLNATAAGSVTLANNSGAIAIGTIGGTVLDLSITASGAISTTTNLTVDE
ncbi:MAG: hypothetical protein KIT69_20100, partial [Propionibacteriaceae bacterium]|nr:hypothetical protein [Propionibacteriaceae bacterium]